MTEFLSMVQSLGVSFGGTIERLREPFLISSALVLIVIALGYLASSSVRFTVDSLLAVKVPTTFKRLLGGLLILLPGIFILATIYYSEINSSMAQNGRHLVAQQKSRSATVPAAGERKFVSSTPRTPDKEPVALNTQTMETEYAVESAGDDLVTQARKQAARRRLVERRLEQQKARRRRGPATYLTKSGQLAAVSEELLDEATKYLADKDMEAFHRLEASQRVVLLKDGERVHILKYEYKTGKVKIRFQSSHVQLWTFRKSLTKE